MVLDLVLLQAIEVCPVEIRSQLKILETELPKPLVRS